MVQWWLWEPFSCCLLRSGTPAFSLWEWLRAPLPPACMPPHLDCLFPIYKAAPSLHNEKVVSRVGRGLGPFPGSQPICSQHPEPQLLSMGWRESKVYLPLLAEYLLKKFPNKTWCYTPSTWHCGVCLPLLLCIIAPQSVIYHRHCFRCLFSYMRCDFHRVKPAHLSHDLMACLGRLLSSQSYKYLVHVFF